MSKNATQRRNRRLAKDLQALATKNPQKFVTVWHHRLDCWCKEISNRARQLRHPRDHANSPSPTIYAIMEKANHLLCAVGSEGERLVGQQTRALLGHECAKAVAAVMDNQLYRLGSSIQHQLVMSKQPHRKSGAR